MLISIVAELSCNRGETDCDKATILKKEKNGRTPDSQPAPGGNNQLSQNRAASVRTGILNDFGLSSLVSSDFASRITTAGAAARQPIASNAIATGRAQNRRIEVRIISNC